MGGQGDDYFDSAGGVQKSSKMIVQYVHASLANFGTEVTHFWSCNTQYKFWGKRNLNFHNWNL